VQADEHDRLPVTLWALTGVWRPGIDNDTLAILGSS
jgi:hypothetical protein